MGMGRGGGLVSWTKFDWSGWSPTQGHFLNPPTLWVYQKIVRTH